MESLTFTHGLAAGYRDLLREVRRHGELVSPRGIDTRELIGVTLYFPNATLPMLPIRTGRGISVKLAAVEALHLIAGATNSKQVLAASPRYTDVLQDPSSLDFGAYGPRVAEQMPKVVRDLTDDPWTRRAVVSIWNPGTDLDASGDRPCTLTLQFLRRNGMLHLITNMRSNDVWLGTPYDVFMFTQLQQTVARVLDTAVGSYTHHVGSLHLYEERVNATDHVHKLSNADRMDLHRDLPNGVLYTGADLEDDAVAHWGRVSATAKSIVDGQADVWSRNYNGWYVHNAPTS